MARKRTSPVHGWLVLDKPPGMTSTQAVGRLKWLFSSKKAGHAGTLDPLATGCLPVAFGEATKTVSRLVDARKTYRFTVRWGAETDTLDAEGRFVETGGRVPDPTEIDAVLGEFTGEISQVPPAYSAILVDGKRAYAMARAGEEVELSARPVDIFALRRDGGSASGETQFLCECGKGTYIRSLARDIARRLGTFGYVVMLRREAVGPFGPDGMISLEKLDEMRHKGAGQVELATCIRGLETALDDIPALAVTPADASRLKSGQSVLLRGRDAPIVTGPCFVSCRGVPVALGRADAGTIHPERVFNLPGS